MTYNPGVSNQAGYLLGNGISQFGRGIGNGLQARAQNQREKKNREQLHQLQKTQRKQEQKERAAQADAYRRLFAIEAGEDAADLKATSDDAVIARFQAAKEQIEMQLKQQSIYGGGAPAASPYQEEHDDLGAENERLQMEKLKSGKQPFWDWIPFVEDYDDTISANEARMQKIQQLMGQSGRQPAAGAPRPLGAPAPVPGRPARKFDRATNSLK